MWQEFNNNPVGRAVGDCAIRALSVALDVSWETAYMMALIKGFAMGDMPSSNSVWGAVLRQSGFQKKNLPEECPECYSFEDFAKDNPAGIYVLGTGAHVATIKDGVIYDAWNSSRETPVYVWYKPDGKENN